MRRTALILWICLLRTGTAVTPPPLCRVSTTDAGREYECLLCDGRDAALREGVTYFVNGDCSFNPVALPVVLQQPVTVTDAVVVRPLDINSATPIVGQLTVAGNAVRLRDLTISSAVQVRGEEVSDLQLTNVTVFDSTVALEVAPTDVHHDINITGLVATGLQSTAASDSAAATLELEPIVSLFHTFGDIQVTCATGQTVVVQPMIPSGIATLTGCTVINFTAILDAYGNAFTYDLYGTPPPEWVATLRSWAITLTAVAAGLLLLTRSEAASTKAPQPTPPPSTPPAPAYVPPPVKEAFTPTTQHKWV